MAKIKKSKCKFCQSETEYLLSSETNAERLLSAAEKLGFIGTKPITPQGLMDLGFEEEYQEPEDGKAGFLYYYINEEECGVDILSNEGGTEVEIGGILKVKDLNLLGEFVAALLNIKERAYSEGSWDEE
tara:strand:- start:792 stop:1178 length:387 start_codon:yes stop_codon:yes gene_type:complete